MPPWGGPAAALLDTLRQHGVNVTQLTLDSRRVQPGDVFLALPGAHADGRAFITDAVARGAAAVIYEKAGVEVEKCAVPPVPTIAVDNLVTLTGEIAHLVYGRPSEQLWSVGVTGTNGKTSVSQWIAQAMTALERKCGVIGTLGNGFPPHLDESPNTTPDAVSLHAALARFVEQGAAACAMEVSSIGLDQGRVNGVHFDVAVLTNLTRDHLEYHGTMAAYGAAKARLFEMPGLGVAVLNLDDPFGVELAARLRGRLPTIGYTLQGGNGTDRVLHAVDLVETATGIAFTLDGVSFTAPLVGRFNASNLLAVTGALLTRGETLAAIAAVLPRLSSPPGRMQTLGGNAQPLVVVDYAHTPDALEKVLTTLRGTTLARGGKLVCVFGCGGNRDAGKRPLMGAIAERLADQVILTSDNPRGENPQAIIAAIRAGMQEDMASEADRAVAIHQAVTQAAARDVILLAGKGHEPYQEIAGVRLPFSDSEIAQSALAGRRERSALAEWNAPHGVRRAADQSDDASGEQAQC
ncbi:MAG: UDP-N-acetylmuramoyl-L-alanyl-D-glutamate--2,6-diaminopimelate ligase [Gammaproteobacteria bacterium]|nr:UDP-N-acetylmuramoyl-L-alanyl-D-glutamate--2,6-diaminopimelate ligase [Rhodocyclaceae bacterium]MBU3910552.1 UDP-N-acetylmuramoyl-L-alanyl-D-glutamate--2,6-diaminopimelate ligase [Gammaproteobacteria bacterium]MBU3988191.1 UDP-N-acetylmuramoyl-L-alanyl-D-glutamate--2,6-diaminopimelate ligase [Gammaproteobacteria bacterium]MBU4005033.1 UDP-N-acetylmuramoyl-L-alanyl-D-glutamate--2,6-diaminopimelate ligase [Gammaproteobacteria bacterium]MBU4020626.1 UDP-N-acetylmuramoyl-L-alanyl-D-glutamate--2,